GNFAHGIAQWDNANPWDKGEASPLWGCHGNVIRNNTVLMANPDRAAFQAIHGSWGSVVYNNVLVNDEPSSFEVDRRSMERLDAGPNVVGTVDYRDGADALASRAVALPDRGRTVRGVTRARFAAEVRRYGEAPWVLIEGGWWRLNPERPDFHPLPGSTL